MTGANSALAPRYFRGYGIQLWPPYRPGKYDIYDYVIWMTGGPPILPWHTGILEDNAFNMAAIPPR
jgi:hypothetical protein